VNLKKLIASALALVALAVFPVLSGNPYYIHLFETIMIYAILLFGLDIVVGYTGQVSLGHAGLFGVGAYTAGVLFFKLGMPFFVTAPLAILITAGFGAILALPALRVSGPYLAMVTLAFGTILQILINEMDFLTNGPMGVKIPKPSLGGRPMNEVEYYWLVAALLVVSLIVVHRVLKSHLGRAFEALRDSPIASDCMGVSVYRYKVYAFVMSAVIAGFAGILYGQLTYVFDPTSVFDPSISIEALVIALVGGAGTILGPAIGAIIVVPATELTLTYLSQAPGLNNIAYAILLFAVAMWFPRGVYPTVAAKVSAVRQRRPAAAGGSKPESMIGEEIDVSF